MSGKQSSIPDNGWCGEGSFIAVESDYSLKWLTGTESKSSIPSYQGVVTYISAVLTPATGIKIWSGPFLDLDRLIAPLKEPWPLIANRGWVGRGWSQRQDPSDLDLSSANERLDRLIVSNFIAWPLDLTLIPVAGVSTAGIYVTTPCTCMTQPRFIARIARSIVSTNVPLCEDPPLVGSVCR